MNRQATEGAVASYMVDEKQVVAWRKELSGVKSAHAQQLRVRDAEVEPLKELLTSA